MPIVKKISEPKPDRYDAFSKVILGALFLLLLGIIILGLSSCGSRSQAVDITATGKNNDNTVNIEYVQNGETNAMFHISVDSLLNFIREDKIK